MNTLEKHGSYLIVFFFSENIDNIDNIDNIVMGHFSELVTDVSSSTVSVQLLTLTLKETTLDRASQTEHEIGSLMT